jgi:hypothetical protein
MQKHAIRRLPQSNAREAVWQLLMRPSFPGAQVVVQVDWLKGNFPLASRQSCAIPKCSSKDINETAFSVVQKATGQAPPPALKPEKNPASFAFGHNLIWWQITGPRLARRTTQRFDTARLSAWERARQSFPANPFTSTFPPATLYVV